jgi:hypothetical protein
MPVGLSESETTEEPFSVVLDTNILVADFGWRSAPFRLLVLQATRGSIQLVLPRLVIQETANKCAERVVKAFGQLNAGHTTLSRLGFESSSQADVPTMLALRGQFEQQLERRLGSKGLILDYPRVVTQRGCCAAAGWKETVRIRRKWLQGYADMGRGTSTCLGIPASDPIHLIQLARLCLLGGGCNLARAPDG